MKKTYYIYVLLLLSISFSSCANRKAISSYEAKSMEMPAVVLTVPTLAELDISTNSVNARVEVPKKNKFSMRQLEENVVALALEPVSGDVLVEPIYKREYNKKGKLIAISVKGFPAKYVKFRTYQAADSLLLEPLRSNKNDKLPEVVYLNDESLENVLIMNEIDSKKKSIIRMPKRVKAVKNKISKTKKEPKLKF